MRELCMELAVRRDFLVGIAPLVVGLVVVAVLTAAVIVGLRIRDREPRVSPEPQPRSGAWQTRDEQDHETPPDHGPGHQDTPRHELREPREPDEVPHDGVRRMPHELHTHGTRSRSEESPEEPPEPTSPEGTPRGKE
ncbi:DUF6479 family protein [Streptomyces sp. NPDC004647]|uniref:DUF6479 family protein n=1 Tax=Streptomyces sp. NPDC004647 TaxID=3154671 RepID=UPI0033BAD4A9